MTRRQLLSALFAAVLLAGITLVLASAGSEIRAALASTQTRLAELRAQRLDPRDIGAMKQVLAAAPDPRTGLLIANDAEAVPRLEAFIRSVALDQRAEIQSMSLTADMMSSKLPVVRGNLHLVVSDENIGSFVKALEAGPPAVFLERLRISYRPLTEGDTEALMLDVATSILVYRHVPAVEKSTP